MITTHEKKRKISEVGFSITLKASDSRKAAANAATLEMIRERVGRAAVYKNRKAYNRRDFKRGDE
jgi:hypothetical protein